jgi:hypothetical protein
MCVCLHTYICGATCHEFVTVTDSDHKATSTLDTEGPRGLESDDLFDNEQSVTTESAFI